MLRERRPGDARLSREIPSLGIGRTFQNIGVYGKLTVLENVLLGIHHVRRGGLFSPLFQPRLAMREERDAVDRARRVLSRLGLEPLADVQAGSLPYGTLKCLELARALVSEPSLLLLDEPAAGLTLGEAMQFGELIRQIKDEFSLTVLLVEHNMRLVMAICGRIIVLNLGRKLAEGSPDAIRGDARVVAAYLGRPA